MTPEDRAAFAAAVVTPLAELTDGLEELRAEIALAAAGTSDTFVLEVLDGVEIDATRAHFAHDITRAVVDFADGMSADAALAQADAALEAGRAIVARRHAAMHDPEPLRLVERRDNATLYPAGYLRFADNLCYWERERTQARNLISGTEDDVPPCFDF